MDNSKSISSARGIPRRDRNFREIVDDRNQQRRRTNTVHNSDNHKTSTGTGTRDRRVSENLRHRAIQQAYLGRSMSEEALEESRNHRRDFHGADTLVFSHSSTITNYGRARRDSKSNGDARRKSSSCDDYVVSPAVRTRSSFGSRSDYRRHSSYAASANESMSSRATRKTEGMEKLLVEGSVRISLRPTDIYDAGDAVLGNIISLPIHSQHHSNCIRLEDEYCTYAGGFGGILSKFRKVLVTDRWGSHVSGVPIFTYGGKGLVGQEDLMDEHIHIRDLADRSTEVDRLEGPVLKAIRHPLWPESNCFIKAPSLVKLTNTMSLHIKDKCSIEGRLDFVSIALLSRNMKALQDKSREAMEPYTRLLPQAPPSDSSEDKSQESDTAKTTTSSTSLTSVDEASTSD